MQKVLSTKLKTEEIDRFVEMAEQQGESKSVLVRRLVLDYLDGGSKADGVASTATSNSANSSNKGLLIHGEGLNSEYLPPVHYQTQTKTQKSTSVVDSDLPIDEDVDPPLNPALLPISRQPVYHNAEPGSPATSPEQPSGIGGLIFGGLLVLGIASGSTTAVDCAAEPVRRKPIMGVYH
ncbi:ribbon-helix-helix domain-containing protein [Chloroflexota bacterium]